MLLQPHTSLQNPPFTNKPSLTCLVGHSLCDESLSRTGGAVQQHAAGGLDAKVLEKRGVAERQLDHLADLQGRKQSQPRRFNGGRGQLQQQQQQVESNEHDENTKHSSRTKTQQPQLLL